MMVYAYVHRITEFGENEPSVQKSVFKCLRVEHCRLSEEIPCGFVSTLHITTSGSSPALWFIQCTCTLQNHKVHPVCFLLTTYLQSAVCGVVCGLVCGKHQS